MSTDAILEQYPLHYPPIHEESDVSSLRNIPYFCCIIATIYIIYGLIGFVIDLRFGFYYIKIPMLAITSLLVFSPRNYSFMVGLIIPIYYYIKFSKYSTPESSFIAQSTAILVILMTFFHFIWKYADVRLRNPLHIFDLSSGCLLLFAIIASAGIFTSQNEYLFFKQYLDVLSFCCGYYLGRNIFHTLYSFHQLIFGLLFGILAFELPMSIGFILREGVGVVAYLDKYFSELNAGGTGGESGILLLIFIIGYCASGSTLSRKLRLTCFWGLALPSVIVIFLFLSKGAILLIPAIILINFILSNKKKAAILVGFLFTIFGFLAYLFIPYLLQGFHQRMLNISEAAFMRSSIRNMAIELGFENMLVGIGTGQFRMHTDFHSAHNEFLNIFAENGIIALMVYIIFLGHTAYKLFILRKSFIQEYKSFSTIFIIIYFSYLAYCQIQPMYFTRGGILFTFCIGLMTTIYNKNKNIFLFDNSR